VIIGIGIDLVEVDRIRQAIERGGDNFLNRIYTADEIAYARAHTAMYERFATRFAACEAAMKALGTGLAQGLTFQDFEVRREEDSAPQLHLRGAAKQLADNLGVRRVHLTLTHTATHAMAVVILESEP
jgi:holo-[acyl-carrier protein] synthase